MKCYVRRRPSALSPDSLVLILQYSPSASFLPASRPHLQMPPNMSQMSLPFDQPHPQ